MSGPTIGRVRRRGLLVAGGWWLACGTGSASPREVLALGDDRILGQVAPPVLAPDGRVLFVTEDALWIVWPAKSHSERRPRPPDLVLDWVVAPGGSRYRARLAGAHTAAGLWLVGGAAAQLLRPDGCVLRVALQPARHDLQLLPQPDGSVLALGGHAWPRSEEGDPAHLAVERIQLAADGISLAIERLPALPIDLTRGRGSWAHFWQGRALRLEGGAVLHTGDRYRPQCWLLEPGATAWQVLPGLLNPARMRPALVQLPDGRVWASGSDDPEAASSSELWDPVTRRWSPGPALPVPMQDHQAVWSHDRRRVLLANGRHAAVLAWTPGASRVSVAALPALQRRGGAAVALPGDRLARVSGLSARDMDEAHGRRSPGMDTLVLAPGPVREGAPLWPALEGAGMARRGDRVLAVGGRLLATYGGGEERTPTRLVELHDLARGQVHTLEPLPEPATLADVVWLDDDRALALAWIEGRWPWLGVLTLDQGWRALDSRPLRQLLAVSERPRAQLAGFDGRQAWLWVNSAYGTLDLSSGEFKTQSQAPRTRQPGRVRLLADGRLVAAGGLAQTDVVATRPEDDEGASETHVGWGPLAPARGHDLFDLVRGGWSPSAPSEAPAEGVAVLDDGRVVQFGRRVGVDGRERAQLERCDAAGRAWETLPWPAGQSDEGMVPELMHLLATDGLLFLRAPVGETHQWWWRAADAPPSEPWRAIDAGPRPLGLPPDGVPLGGVDARGRALWALGGSSGIVVFTR